MAKVYNYYDEFMADIPSGMKKVTNDFDIYYP